MANPQPSPFVQFSKELFDALLVSPMPATHKEIVLAVIRRTYGDRGRKEAPISHSLIRHMTGRADSGIRKSMTALEAEGVLIKVSEATFRSPAVWRLNKDYEKWGRWSVRSATLVAEGQELADCHQDSAGECHHGGRGECHHGGTIEDIETRDINIPSGAEAPETAQTLVAFAVDRAKGLGVALTDRQKGHLAREVGKQFKAGADPILIRNAVGVLVDENKSPDNLGYVMRDLKRNGGERERARAHSGRSTNGEWE